MAYFDRRRQGLICLVALLVTVSASQADRKSSGTGWFNSLFNKSRTSERGSRSGKLSSGVVRGVVVQRLTEINRRGKLQYGFVLQSTVRTADRNAKTSDAVYVLVGESKTIDGKRGEYKPRVGDEIILRGTSETYYGRPTFRNPQLVKRVRSNVVVEEEIAVFEVDPPETLDKADAYWKARHGMRCRIPAGSLVQGTYYPDGREGHSFISLILPDHAIARRSMPYARRVFRDAHPLDDHGRAVLDNGNGFLLTISDAVLKAKRDRTTPQLPRVHTFDATLAPVEGVVLRTDNRYIIHIEDAVPFERGHPPDGNLDPSVAIAPGNLTVLDYNIENYYDTRDDPFDNRDYYSRAPNPKNSNVVARLHNYVPASEAAYRRKTDGLARQIVNDLGAPDLVMIQETEDQDICAVENGRLVIGGVNNRDGKLDSLQDLALSIRKAGGPDYDIAADRGASDTRGIICAFMFRKDRLALADVSGNPFFQGAPQIPYAGQVMAYSMGPANPRALNAEREGLGPVFTRSPTLACFRAIPGEDAVVPEGRLLYVLNNHFKSIPNMYVEMRIEQARLNAAIGQAIREQDPDAWIIVGGDLNTFPRPDEPLPGEPGDQLGALYDVGLVNLYDRMLKERPESAYTYIYRGQAQTLDHLFLSPGLERHLRQVRTFHINSDFPPDAKTIDRRCSDHDPILAVFDLSAAQ